MSSAVENAGHLDPVGLENEEQRDECKHLAYL